MAPERTANRAASPAPRKAVEATNGDENAVAAHNVEAVVVTEVVAKESVVVQVSKGTTAAKKEAEKKEELGETQESAPSPLSWKRLAAVFLTVVSALCVVAALAHGLWYYGPPGIVTRACHQGLALAQTPALQKVGAVVVGCTAASAVAFVGVRAFIRRRSRAAALAATCSSTSATSKPKSE